MINESEKILNVTELLDGRYITLTSDKGFASIDITQMKPLVNRRKIHQHIDKTHCHTLNAERTA